MVTSLFRAVTTTTARTGLYPKHLWFNSLSTLLPACATASACTTTFNKRTRNITGTNTTTSINKERYNVYKGASFVFDIDGVLWISRKPIPQAITALNSLYDPLKQTWKYPIVFLTNSGGVTEHNRASTLSSIFNLPITSDMIVLSHTPLRSLAHQYRSKTVLTIGGEKCAHVIRSYGFPYALDTSHLAAIRPTISPFAHLKQTLISQAEIKAQTLPIGAIFVMTDSKDWGRDTQILIDIFLNQYHTNDNSNDKRFTSSIRLSSTILARKQKPPTLLNKSNINLSSSITSNESLPTIYYTNSDLLFPTSHAHPRLAGGSFRIVFNSIYNAMSQSQVGNRNISAPREVLLGKPHAPNYIEAEQSIQAQLVNMGYHCENNQHMGSIYAIGDNPASDIVGANDRGPPWKSILVRTGNFGGDENIEHLDVQQRPYAVVDDVLQAVGLGVDEQREAVKMTLTKI